MKLSSSERSPKARRLVLVNTPTGRRSQIEKRRSSRMALNASIWLSGEDRHKIPFTMSAKATSLNQHGAAICIQRELLAGSTVLVRNQRGTRVSARVVAELAAFQEIPTYAIEFIDQDDKTKNFWGIAFPSNCK